MRQCKRFKKNEENVVPPQENQGDLPKQPNQVGQAPEPPLPPQSVAGQGQPEAQPGQPPLSRRKKLITAFAAAVVILATAALLAPFSPFTLLKATVPKGPKMMVGDNNPFVYACSVFDAATVSKELGLNQDKSKQNAEETLSFDPSNIKDKSVNLIKQTGETNVDSNCKLKFDRVVTTGSDGKETTSFINVSAYVQQFPGEKEASDKFDQAKKTLGKDVKALASYGESSYYVTPVKPPGGPTYVQPVVKYKNMLIYFTAPLKDDDPAAEKMVGQLDNVAKDVLKRIAAKQGEKPKDFSGVAKIGKNKFVDACQSVNYQKFAKAIGGDAQYEPTSFSATQSYAPIDSGKLPTHFLSMCSFDFRTKADADALASQRPENLLPTGDSADAESPYHSHYPHFALIQIVTTENNEGAQKIVTDFKKSGETQPDAPKIEDVKIGDLAFRVDSPHSDDNPYDNRFYYIAKGSHAYLVSVSYKRQSQPFKTTDQGFSDDQAKQMLDILVAASSYAQKK